ncbi:MAG: hypothetical protein HC898_02265 [Phycisphaerales bacterium]|nr:hypothetical protein [Phycisphaerales bacterium]
MIIYTRAASMNLNTLKVPIKWSMVEPEPGVYDFSYVDHVLQLARQHGLKLILCWFGHYGSSNGNIYRNMTGEVYAPMYVIEDDQTYPRAIDVQGRVHHNAISYAYQPIVDVETKAFCAFMRHIKEVDDGTYTVVMIQVENGNICFWRRVDNRLHWRDYAPAALEAYNTGGFKEDLSFSAWLMAEKWIKPLTNAGKAIYPLPFFVNFVNVLLRDCIVGGSAGEDVATYLKHCPSIDFCGANMYVRGQGNSNILRMALNRYLVGRNIPAITETNSDTSPMASRVAYLAIGEYGVPIFAPWALNTSYPTPHKPYVLPDGSIANGARQLATCYRSLQMALPLIAKYSRTNQLKVFMSHEPGQKFSMRADLCGTYVAVEGEDIGQALVIQTQSHEYYMIGYACNISIQNDQLRWPMIKQVSAEHGIYDDQGWNPKGHVRYVIDQSLNQIRITMTEPQVVRVVMPQPS